MFEELVTVKYVPSLSLSLSLSLWNNDDFDLYSKQRKEYKCLIENKKREDKKASASALLESVWKIPQIFGRK